MARHIKLRAMKLRRNTLILLTWALASSLLYGWYLHHQNRAAKTYLAQLQKTEPDRYLTELRKLNGFSAYVEAYRRVAKFDQFRPDAPVFIQGRWSLRAAPKRLSLLEGASDCTDPITFEYGRLSLGNAGKTTFRAEYRLVGETLEVKTPSGPVAVTLVPYGESLDHLELVPPARDKTFYAYRCRT